MGRSASTIPTLTDVAWRAINQEYASNQPSAADSRASYVRMERASRMEDFVLTIRATTATPRREELIVVASVSEVLQ